MTAELKETLVVFAIALLTTISMTTSNPDTEANLLAFVLNLAVTFAAVYAIWYAIQWVRYWLNGRGQ